MKIQRKVLGATIGSPTCFLISGICAGAAYVNYEINFTHYPQEKSNWCWAASAQAAGKYVTPSSSINQYGAVYRIKGSYDNVTATIEETADAATYISLNGASFKGMRTVISSEAIIEKILHDHVTIGAYGYYDPETNSRCGGHQTTVTRFEAFSSTQRNIYLYDPAANEVKVYDFTRVYTGNNDYWSGGYIKIDRNCKY